MQYLYTLKLLDQVTAPLQKIASTGASAYKGLADGQRKWMDQQKQAQSNTMGLGNMIGAYIGFQGVKSFFELGSAMQNTKVAFDTLLGSTEKGAKMFQAVTKMADETPFTNSDLEKSATMLLNFGISQEKVIPIMKMLGDVSMGNTDKMNSLTLAFSQVSSAGKMQGQDLLQFINAGFNPLQIISQKTGKSMAQLRSEMEKGAISSAMVADAFKTATSQGGPFFGMMDKMSQTMSGKWSTLTGNFSNFVANMSTQTSGTVTKILDLGIEVVGFLQRNNKLIMDMAIAVGLVVGVYFTIVGLTKAWMLAEAAYNTVKFIAIGLTQGWTVAQTALNVAMMMNPVGLVVAAVVALVAIIAVCWNNFEGFRRVILGTWEVIKEFGKMMGGFLLDMIMAPIKALGLLGEAVVKLFKGDVSGAMSSAKDAVITFGGGDAIKNATVAGEKLGDAYRMGAAKGIDVSGGAAERQAAIEAKRKADLEMMSRSGGGVKGDTKAKAAARAKATYQTAIDKALGEGKTDTRKTDPLATDTNTKSGVDGITSGGSKQTNITVNVNKLIEGLTIRAEGFKEGTSQMRDMVQEELLRVLNSANTMAHGS